MRKFTVEIECDNAAFDDFYGELHACLERVQVKIANGRDGGFIMDTNGNRVGEFKLIEG